MTDPITPTPPAGLPTTVGELRTSGHTFRTVKQELRENLLARDHSLFCSAFVVHLYRKVRVDLAPGLDSKNVTPEDLARTNIPHTTFLLKRDVPASRLAKVATRVKRRLQARARQIRRAASSLRRA